MGEMANDVDFPTFDGAGTKAKIIFEELGKLLPEHGEELCKKIQAVFLFKVYDHGKYNRPTATAKYAFWLVDLKNGCGSIRPVDKGEPCDVMFFGSDDNVENILTGLQNPAVEFFRGHFVCTGRTFLLPRLKQLKPFYGQLRARL